MTEFWREFSDGCWVGDRVGWVERTSSSRCAKDFRRHRGEPGCLASQSEVPAERTCRIFCSAIAKVRRKAFPTSELLSVVQVSYTYLDVIYIGKVALTTWYYWEPVPTTARRAQPLLTVSCRICDHLLQRAQLKVESLAHLVSRRKEGLVQASLDEVVTIFPITRFLQGVTAIFMAAIRMHRFPSTLRDQLSVLTLP